MKKLYILLIFIIVTINLGWSQQYYTITTSEHVIYVTEDYYGGVTYVIIPRFNHITYFYYHQPRMIQYNHNNCYYYRMYRYNYNFYCYSHHYYYHHHNYYYHRPYYHHTTINFGVKSNNTKQNSTTNNFYGNRTSQGLTVPRPSTTETIGRRQSQQTTTPPQRYSKPERTIETYNTQKPTTDVKKPIYKPQPTTESSRTTPTTKPQQNVRTHNRTVEPSRQTISPKEYVRPQPTRTDRTEPSRNNNKPATRGGDTGRRR